MARKKYRQSAGLMREFIALAVFVVGVWIYDGESFLNEVCKTGGIPDFPQICKNRAGSEGGGNVGANVAGLLMMLGAGFFLCCAVVERIFFLPRLRGRNDPAEDIGGIDAPKHDRNETINYAGPRVPRAFSQDPHSGPDGLDPIPVSEQYYAESEYSHAAAAGEEEGEIEGVVKSESESDSDSEDDHVFHEEMKSTLTDPFFSGGTGGKSGDGK